MEAVTTATLPVAEQKDAFVDAPTAFSNLAQPRLASLTELLVQGTISKDNDMLEKALSVADMDLIKSALRKMPEEHVLALLDEIVSRIQRKPLRALQLVPWLRTLLLVRTNYLVTVPGLDAKLRPLQAIIDARTKTYRRMVQLRGRLDLMLQQVEEQKREQSPIKPSELHKLVTTPMAVYDESDTEEAGFGGGMEVGDDGMEVDDEGIESDETSENDPSHSDMGATSDEDLASDQ